MRSMEMGMEEWRVLFGILLLAKGECKKASKFAAARRTDGEGGQTKKTKLR